MKRKIAYIAGPYRGPTTEAITANIAAARTVAVEVWKLGYVALCPHLNTAHFDGILPDSAWLDGDLELLSRCDLLVCTPDWRRSTGATAEVAFARDHGIPVFEHPDRVPPEPPW